MSFTYRMQTNEDRDELIRLWNNQAGWDELSRKEWERRFLDTPFGPAAISLAIDSEKDTIIGQCIFIPTRVSVDGQELASFRTFAPLLHTKLRGASLLNPLKHPIYRMYKFATEYFAQNGTQLVYSMPDPRWLRAFQFLKNFYIGKFPLWSLALPLGGSIGMPPGYETRRIEPNDVGLNELWLRTAKFYNCAIVRRSDFLPWKTSHGTYFYQGIFLRDELVAWVASIYKERDKQWLICDILAIDEESLKTAICVSCQQADEFLTQNPTKEINKAAILATEMILPIVKELDFFRDDYDFPLVVHLLDKSLSKEKILPSRWYLSAND
jgi:hypothetical protein